MKATEQFPLGRTGRRSLSADVSPGDYVLRVHMTLWVLKRVLEAWMLEMCWLPSLKLSIASFLWTLFLDL